MRWSSTLLHIALLGVLVNMPCIALAQEDAPSQQDELLVAEVDWAPIDADLSSGNWQGAGDTLATILNDPAQEAAHGAAWGRLGSALHAGGLPFAAMRARHARLARDASPASIHPRIRIRRRRLAASRAGRAASGVRATAAAGAVTRNSGNCRGDSGPVRGAHVPRPP